MTKRQLLEKLTKIQLMTNLLDEELKDKKRIHRDDPKHLYGIANLRRSMMQKIAHKLSDMEIEYAIESINLKLREEITQVSRLILVEDKRALQSWLAERYQHRTR